MSSSALGSSLCPGPLCLIDDDERHHQPHQ